MFLVATGAAALAGLVAFITKAYNTPVYTPSKPLVLSPLTEYIGEHTVENITTSRGYTKATLTVGPGVTAKQVLSKQDEMHSYMNIYDLRILPVHGKPRTFVFTAVHEDVLAEPTPYPGASFTNASVSNPLHIGVQEDGDPELLYLPGSPTRSAAIVLIAGVPGSGKSRLAWVVWAELATRNDVVLWLSDTTKGAQTAKPIASMVDWLAPTKMTTQDMLSSIEAITHYRANYLGDKGLEQWEEGCGLPYLVLWVEEAAQLGKELFKYITGISQTVRSVGICLVVSIQRPSSKAMDTDARSSFTTRLCYGLNEENTAPMILGKDTIEAGAKPWNWRANHPGMHYTESSSTPLDQWPNPNRTYNISIDQLTSQVNSHTSIRATLDEGSAQAAGQAYLNRNNTPEPPTPSGGSKVTQDPTPTKPFTPKATTHTKTDPAELFLRDLYFKVLNGVSTIEVRKGDLDSYWYNIVQDDSDAARQRLTRVLTWMEFPSPSRGVYTITAEHVKKVAARKGYKMLEVSEGV